MIQLLKKYYDGFTEEASLFFVTKFITSPTIEKEYSNCLDIIFDVTKTVDTGRGIVAFNAKYGQGKSFFFEVINHRYKRVSGKSLFKKYTAKELIQLYSSTPKGEDPQQRLIDAISTKMLFIDDIGDEGDSRIVKSYGNEFNVIRFVLLKRYEDWTEKGWKTYCTTNMTIEQIAKAYDGRVADRLLQMCFWREFNFIKTSFRQVEESRRLTQKEINDNLEKFNKTEVEKEAVDLDKYFNELVEESDDYFTEKDNLFWDMVKQYLLGKELLKKEELTGFSEEEIRVSELELRDYKRSDVKDRYKRAPAEFIMNEIQRVLKKISHGDIVSVAENRVAKKRFFELRKQKHKF